MIDTARSAQTATWPGPSVDPRRWTNRDVQVHLKPEGWQHGPQRGQQRKLTTHTRMAQKIFNKESKTTLVASAKGHAVMRTKQDEEHQELHEVTEDMNERQRKLLAIMERKRKLMRGAWNFGNRYFWRSGSWMKELLQEKEDRSEGVE